MLDTLYRIQTEHAANVQAIASRHFDAFTLTQGVGYWHGVPEAQNTIEVLGQASDAMRVEALAEELRVTNRQQAVLVTQQVVSGHLVQAQVKAA